MRSTLVAVILCCCMAALASASEIRIITDPEGAEVWLGQVRLGTTTRDGLRILDAPEGLVTYSIRKEGFVTVERTLTVNPDEPVSALVRLEPIKGRVLETRAQTSQEATPTGPQKKNSHKGLIALGVIGGAAAVGVGVAVLGKTDPLEVDDDGDGVSEKAGDCNDADRQISPNGAFTISVSPDLVGAVTCNTPQSNVVIRASNLGCGVVSVQSAIWTSAHVSGNCSGGNFTRTLEVVASSVTSGARDVIVATRAESGPAGCCSGSGGYCGQNDSICGWQQTYTVNTNKGPFSHNNSYTITFPRGYSCQSCATSGAIDVEAQSCGPPPGE